MQADKIASVVSDLIERCKDGREGYRTAAEDVQDQDLKSLFQEYALQRDRMITELQNELHKIGQTQDESGSLSGTIHRAWIDLKSAISSNDRKRILEECERGEDYAVAAYKKALKEELPGPISQIVHSQYERVQSAHDHIRDLRDSA
ncbi:PA2169 family four-helix-bundle protein [soil metagenome]|jgi:uncharacterized protein (TIGR02284 family)